MASEPAQAKKVSTFLGIGSLQRSQLETLQGLITKHLTDPSFLEIASTEDFHLTSLERGIPRYEHSHLVAALDVLLTYQRERKCRSAGMKVSKSYTHDPRTRLVELLKRWLRLHAVDERLEEEDLRRMCGLVRDVLNHPRLFPSRNSRSFMQTVAEVYEHLEFQLREVLERDRTCADLAARVLSLSRNLISDALAYLLLGPTDLRATDKLPSLEVVSLWSSLPADRNPLPKRADPSSQQYMEDSWQTLCGSLIAALLSLPWAFRLFNGANAQDEACAAAAQGALKAVCDITQPSSAHSRQNSTNRPVHPADVIPTLVREVEDAFRKGQFKASGLAGNFREPEHEDTRESYLTGVESVFDLMYLLGEVIVQFHRISDGLGDYGMIRVAPWLHPCLDSVTEKVNKLRISLDKLSQSVDNVLVLSRARGRSIKKPTPSERMSARAHACIQRAVTGRDSHVELLLKSLEELKARSAPDRLPHVAGELTDACKTLQLTLASPEFRARVGDAFPNLPTIGNIRMGASTLPTMPSLQSEALPPMPALQSEAVQHPSAGGIHVDWMSCSTVKVEAWGEFSDEEDDDDDREVRERLAETAQAVQALIMERSQQNESQRDDPQAQAAMSSTVSPSSDEDISRTKEEVVKMFDDDNTTNSTEVPVSEEGKQSPYGYASPDVRAAIPRNVHHARSMRAEVFRLSFGTGGWKRHDGRSLRLKNGQLEIFAKSSTDYVKTTVDISSGILDYAVSGSILSLQICRPRRSSAWGWGENQCKIDEKSYFFEFVSPEMATAFHKEISNVNESEMALLPERITI